MTLAEEFDIRALDPILITAAEERRARETMAASVDATERVRAMRMVGILAMLEDGEARTRASMLERLPAAQRRYAADRFTSARNGALIERAGQVVEGGHNRLLWRITPKGRARLAVLRAWPS